MNATAKNQELGYRINLMLGDTPEAIVYTSRTSVVDVARTLRRAQLTLHRWSEEMCNGTIQREGPDGDGKPFRVWDGSIGQDLETKRMKWGRITSPTPDREAGALRRIEQVCKEAGLHFYHQTDPRGCALFVSAQPMNDTNYSQLGVPCI